MSAGLIGCNPPESCFRCPFSDCRNDGEKTKAESDFTPNPRVCHRYRRSKKISRARGAAERK